MLKTPPSLLERDEHCADDVLDEHVIARLASVAIDPGRAALVQESHEDRDDAGFAVRFLARPIDVGEPERDVAGAVKTVPGREVLLAAELRRPVGGERLPFRRLRDGTRALAVDRAAGR